MSASWVRITATAKMTLEQARVVRDSEAVLGRMKQMLREEAALLECYPFRLSIPDVGVITIQAPEDSDSKARISFTF